MKFLVDAQLPRRLCAWLREAGYDAIHTLDLPLGNRTPDTALLDIATREQRVMVTKDDDFLQSHLISGNPEKLLLVTTGNVSNAELERLLRANVVPITKALESGNLVEVGRNALIIHD